VLNAAGGPITTDRFSSPRLWNRFTSNLFLSL
jgi:hypothetical protein